MEELIKEFNLPDYIKSAKSFSEASKMIMGKFDEREDPASKRTMNELMGRLRDAQEYIKAESLPNENLPTQDHALGGILQGITGALGGSNGGDGGILKTGMNLVQSINGNNNSPTGQQPDQGMSAVSGALDGAKMGMAFGPLGAGVGALAGTVKGLFDGGEAKEAWAKGNRESNAAYSNNVLNTYAYGGNMEPDPISGLNLKSLPGEDTGFDNTLASTNLQPREGNPGFLQRFGNKANIMLGDAGEAIKNGFGKATDFASNNVDKLRFAPAAINALELMNMEQAPETSLNRLDARYNPEYVDEQALQNTAREQYNNTAEALGSASGGSTSSLRSNILAAGLNRTKALDSAYSRAANINRGENRTAQQFNLGIDKANLAQDNLEIDIRARDKGAYETNRSAALARLGQDIGNIGKEAADRDIIEGLYGYDTKGNYLNKRKPKAKGHNAKARPMYTPGFNPQEIDPTSLKLFR